MKTFRELYERAVARKGKAALEARFPVPRTAAELAATPDHRYLAEMAKGIFAAGFVWRVVEAKWDGFENAFNGFEPRALARAGDAEKEALLQDAGIIRHAGKIQAVLDNARMMTDVAAEHGSFGKWVAEWPSSNIVGLWELLGKRGARLSGSTCPYFLRRMGKDTFILSRDVVAALAEEGITGPKASSKRDLAAAQTAFNQWQAESGLPLCQISITLACTIDSGGDH